MTDGSLVEIRFNPLSEKLKAAYPPAQGGRGIEGISYLPFIGRGKQKSFSDAKGRFL